VAASPSKREGLVYKGLRNRKLPQKLQIHVKPQTYGPNTTGAHNGEEERSSKYLNLFHEHDADSLIQAPPGVGVPGDENKSDRCP